MSECSDDFICFEYDDNDFGNCIHGVNETTDEEFTSDSDDSDDETSDSDSDECDFGEPKRFSIENNPPDSGFEERKVGKMIFICSIRYILPSFGLILAESRLLWACSRD